MSECRFLVAKYIPDPMRMEPRNIGVVAWNDGRTALRMLEPGQARFVRDKRTYRRWRDYWTERAASDSIEHGRGEVTFRGDHKFLDALRTTSKANYVLTEGGFLLDRIRGDTIEQVADHLFAELVLPKPARRRV